VSGSAKTKKIEESQKYASVPRCVAVAVAGDVSAMQETDGTAQGMFELRLLPCPSGVAC